MQNNQPIDKGRVAVIAEKYQSNQVGNQNQPVMRNRYATVGRATLWPCEQGSNMPNIQIELDTMPLNANGPVKMYIFWDSESQHNQQQQQPQYQQPQQGYQR